MSARLLHPSGAPCFPTVCGCLRPLVGRPINVGDPDVTILFSAPLSRKLPHFEALMPHAIRMRPGISHLHAPCHLDLATSSMLTYHTCSTCSPCCRSTCASSSWQRKRPTRRPRRPRRRQQRGRPHPRQRMTCPLPRIPRGAEPRSMRRRRLSEATHARGLPRRPLVNMYITVDVLCPRNCQLRDPTSAVQHPHRAADASTCRQVVRADSQE